MFGGEREPHTYYASTTGDYLRSFLGDRAQGRESHPITIPATQSEPESDLAIVQPLGRESLQQHPYPENIFWLIEFAQSSLQKDADPKAKAYAAAGIPEDWMVNLQTMTLMVFRHPIQDGYQSQITLTEGTLPPLAFADGVISVLPTPRSP